MHPKIFPITCHTDHVGPGTTFVAICGLQDDGARYIKRALELGATRIIVDQVLSSKMINIIKHHKAQLTVVRNARIALALESARAHDFPAKKLKIFGITGTKGKTTTAFLFAHVLKNAGNKTALISSAGNYIQDEKLPASLTTPQPDYLHAFLRECVKRGITHVVLEAAAQAFSCSRLEGIKFDGIIFTNFSREHGEFYATQDLYLKAKCEILKHLKESAPVLLNHDDEVVRNIYSGKRRIAFGLQAGQILGKKVISELAGLSLTVRFNSQEFFLSTSSLIGEYNAYNILAAVSLAECSGISLQKIQEAIFSFTGVPGRLNPQEIIKLSSGAYAVIDKAHNPSSYQAVLSTLRPLTDCLIVVFGAGGERDKQKRPLMGAIAESFSDYLIITSDDPRSEEPQQIIDDIMVGVEGKASIFREIDRARALKIAVELSGNGAIIAILGKGCDEYQLVGAVKHHFSERKILSRL